MSEGNHVTPEDVRNAAHAAGNALRKRRQEEAEGERRQREAEERRARRHADSVRPVAEAVWKSLSSWLRAIEALDVNRTVGLADIRIDLAVQITSPPEGRRGPLAVVLQKGRPPRLTWPASGYLHAMGGGPRVEALDALLTWAKSDLEALEHYLQTDALWDDVRKALQAIERDAVPG